MPLFCSCAPEVPILGVFLLLLVFLLVMGVVIQIYKMIELQKKNKDEIMRIKKRDVINRNSYINKEKAHEAIYKNSTLEEKEYNSCSKCGTKYVKNALFCHKCGTSINTKVRFCQYCGVLRIKDGIFCYKCGNLITQLIGLISNEDDNQVSNSSGEIKYCMSCGAERETNKEEKFCSNCGGLFMH